MTYDLADDIRPQDDLFRHVNGRWLATAQIPEDRSSTGAFIKLRDDAEAAIRDIVTSLDPETATATSQAAKVAALYASFMDEARIDSLALAPLEPLLAQIDAIADIPGLLTYFGNSLRRDTGSPIDVDIDSDPGDPSRYVLFVAQSGIGLPDEEYYRLPKYAPLREQYRDHINRMLTLAQVSSGAAPTIFELESAVATAHWDKIRTRDMRAMYNPMSESDFCADFDWHPLLRAAGIPEQDTIIVAQPSFFTDLAKLLTPGQLDAWKLWAKWALVSSLSPYLPAALTQANFDFYGTILQGTPQLRTRWKRGVSLVERFLGDAVGKIYVERYFPADSKAQMDTLVANLLAAYRESITTLDWMSDATRAEALRKLDKFTPKIGYPERWMDYTALEMDATDLIGNALRAAAFHTNDEISKLGGAIRTWEWLMTPQTVNAYYHPLRNEIVFPAAILQPPFFDPAASDAENYGSIGAVIGHEIGHGFDDQGSTCDGDGKLRDWWTPADREAFEERTKSLISQYDALVPAQLVNTPNPPHVNGELTIGENIGDLGGLGIAYHAWQLAGGRGSAQEFFYAWAVSWQGLDRDEALSTQIATDPHAPEEFRCNQVVRNLAAFYETFDVQPSDALWLPESERVRIW